MFYPKFSNWYPSVRKNFHAKSFFIIEADYVSTYISHDYLKASGQKSTEDKEKNGGGNFIIPICESVLNLLLPEPVSEGLLCTQLPDLTCLMCWFAVGGKRKVF